MLKLTRNSFAIGELFERFCVRGNSFDGLPLLTTLSTPTMVSLFCKVEEIRSDLR